MGQQVVVQHRTEGVGATATPSLGAEQGVESFPDEPCHVLGR